MDIRTDPRFRGIEPFANRVWLSSPTMHGDEQRWVDEAIQTNWVSTVGRNIDEVEKQIAHLWDKHAIEAVFGSKINIALDVLSRRAMTTVGFGFGIIRDADMDRREIPCVAPIAHTRDHLPPYAYILHGLDP